MAKMTEQSSVSVNRLSHPGSYVFLTEKQVLSGGEVLYTKLMVSIDDISYVRERTDNRSELVCSLRDALGNGQVVHFFVKESVEEINLALRRQRQLVEEYYESLRTPTAPVISS